jgi:hypothetical protein
MIYLFSSSFNVPFSIKKKRERVIIAIILEQGTKFGIMGSIFEFRVDVVGK